MSRSSSLDVLKTICCFMVVFIHANFDNSIGFFLGNGMLCRIAVPLFFMISGYFAYKKDNKKIWSSIMKILKMMIYATIIYFVFELAKCILMKESISLLLKSYINIQFLVFNMGTISGHLWYIRALIYVYIIYILIKKYKKEKIILPIVFIIYIFDLIICKYSKVIFGSSLPVSIYEPITKYIGTAFVYFSLGYFINKNYDGKKRKCFYVYALISLIFNIVEYLFLEHTGFSVHICNWIFTLPLVVSIFMIFAFNLKFSSNNILAIIGSKYSTYIYLYHIFVVNVFDFVFKNYFQIYMYFRAIIVFFITLFIVMLINKLKRKKVVY